MSNQVERCEATVCGHRMSYLRAGPLGGSAVVLLHGLASDSGTWTPAIPLLAGHGLRVFALDLLGHGDSDKPAISYELDELARQVEQFLTAVDVPRATVCGHSLGGAVAMQVAFRYPERVERMVLVAAGGLGRQVHVALRAAAVPGAQYLLGAALRPSLIRVYRRPGFHRALRLRPDAVVNLRRAGRALGSVEGRSAFFASLNGVISPSGQRGSFIEMRNLATHVPVLLVWSERDGDPAVARARRSGAPAGERAGGVPRRRARTAPAQRGRVRSGSRGLRRIHAVRSGPRQPRRKIKVAPRSTGDHGATLITAACGFVQMIRRS